MALRAAPTKKADALRANRAVKVGAFRDIRTEKADVFTIRADQSEKRDVFRAAFRAHGFEKEGSFRADEVKKGGFGGGGTYPYCLTMGVPHRVYEPPFYLLVIVARVCQ